MLEQLSVKLKRVIIFYFISNFLIYAPILPKKKTKTSAFRSVFVFRAVFKLLYSCFGRKSKCAANANHCMFLLETGPERIQILRHLDGAFDSAPSKFFCSLANQNVTFVTLFRTINYLCSALNYLFFSAPCYIKTAFLLANHNREIFSCILLMLIINDDRRCDTALAQLKLNLHSIYWLLLS